MDINIKNKFNYIRAMLGDKDPNEVLGELYLYVEEQQQKIEGLLDDLVEVKTEVLRTSHKLFDAQGNKWINISDEIPPVDNHEYYGTMHSIPVLIYDHYNNPTIVRWDRHHQGWIDSNYSEGYSSRDYDYTADSYLILPGGKKENK